MVHGPLVRKYLQRLWRSVMNKVYIVFLDNSFYGIREIYGVYVAEERAEEICDALNANSIIQSYCVEEWEVEGRRYA